MISPVSILSNSCFKLDSYDFPVKKRILKLFAPREESVKMQMTSWSKILIKIEFCTQQIVAKESQQQRSYDDYRKAAGEFSEITDHVKITLCRTFCSATREPKEQFDALRKFSQTVHPFPVNEAIYKREKDLLQKALQAIQELAMNSKAVELKEELQTRTCDLEFNYAYFFGIKALERINSFQQKTTGKVFEESVDIAEEMSKSIENYKNVESLYMQRGDVNAANVCRESIAVGIERLADHYFDAAQRVDPVSRVFLFNRAIETYQSMKKYVKPLPEEIIHSIFEARYLMAKSLMELKSIPQAKQQLLQLRAEMKLFLKNEDYLRWHFANFYNLESLVMLYEIEPNDSIKRKAQIEIDWLLSKQSQWSKERSIQAEVSSWIAKAQTLFQ